MKRAPFIIIIIILVLAVVAAAYWLRRQTNTNINATIIEQMDKNAFVAIGGQTVKAEVADDIAERMQGLSGKDKLCPNCGMLFIFEKPDIYPFWMKDMNFNLDIIWLRDKKIVEIVENAQNPIEAGEIKTYTPSVEADMVLEVPAGFFSQNGVKIGDEININ